MKKYSCIQFKGRFIAFVLVAAIVLGLTGCAADSEDKAASADKKSFTVTVTYEDGTEESLSYSSDAEYLGEALIAEGLIEGEDSEFGLYLKTVNGVTVDYDTDGKYWAFYINGEYASSGVDTTPIEEGAEYGFKVE